MAGQTAAARIAEDSDQRAETAVLLSELHDIPGGLGQRVALKEGEDTSLDLFRPEQVATINEPPAVVGIMEVSAQIIPPMDERPALVAPVTECEQIWDHLTHMTRKEWAEVCRRVDETGWR